MYENLSRGGEQPEHVFVSSSYQIQSVGIKNRNKQWNGSNGVLRCSCIKKEEEGADSSLFSVGRVYFHGFHIEFIITDVSTSVIASFEAKFRRSILLDQY